MVWINKIARLAVLVALPAVIIACSISYKFNGASINYDKVKTISIADFPIKSTYVYQPLANKFNDDLKDIFTRQTRLQLVRSANADLQIEGEITGINTYNEAVAADGYSSKAKVTITVNVRFVNNTNHEEDFEQQFSAFRSDLDPNSLLPNIPDATIAEITKEITDQIFNATVANW
ncbi:LptE family protein [Bacteroides sp.]